ncbi:aminotransferase class IV [Marinospirillum insulare]|uniref:Aminodeoxychorismate lyase n=1 Tax=Marinospirillum insulare TaxID=217169 RepID=A0ABQ5ZYA8_9GAMM|nr:aminotransferase class IV [Marinospirillum insulare]GLR64283.1 aminodeoxychorismate lyase [Marinospirillum insulare]
MTALPPMLLDGRQPTASDLDWLLASRALAFGEGVFTTLRVTQGQAVFIEDHLWRLQKGLASLLYSTETFDWPLLKLEIDDLAQALQEGMLKVMLLAGPGGVGYRRAKHQAWHRFIHPRRLTVNQSAYQGIACWWQACPGSNPEPASKHLNRLSQILASEGCPDTFLEALQYNVKGEVSEAIARNVFWYSQGAWHTPSLASGALAGVMRRQLLQHLTTDQVIETSAGLAELQQAEEVFVCNSLQGIWPVIRLEDTSGTLAHWSVGPQTQQLMAAFHPLLGLPLN